MKKIIFCDIPMRKDLNAVCYAGKGNAGCNYAGKVIFPINAVLAERLKSGDEVKVVLLKTSGGDDCAGTNAGRFISELDAINKNIGAAITYETLETAFDESKENHEKRFRQMLDKIENECEIYADITYGPRTLPMVLMCVLNFAEKFFDADIKKIVYGKVEYYTDTDGKRKVKNPELYDLTSLYYLNNLTNSMEAENGEAALKAIDSFFAL